MRKVLTAMNPVVETFLFFQRVLEDPGVLRRRVGYSKLL